MEEIQGINVLYQYGAMGVMLGYFIFKDFVVMKRFTDTLQELKQVVTIMKEAKKQ